MGFLVDPRNAVSTVLFFLLVCSFQFSLAVLFLLLTSFIVCQAILDCLSSTESLILSIWLLLIHFVLFFFSFRAFVFVGLFLLNLEAVFTSARFSLTANVSHWTLDLVLSFVVCISLLPRGVYWRNSHIRHSGYAFLSSPVVHRIVSQC